ncbi:hypothetical protein E2C01_033744 [Portunus trituberculatus]|uniref:Uncharacterized protein n=1 Tax=Portunus trituberculatus TaxID=210409 RepID=A0A5B7F4V6_PORTR|nr:hypothetical protein [Portunus trituberculatus]
MVAEPKMVADLLSEHFLSISQKVSAALGARHSQGLEAQGVNFASVGVESYDVPLSSFKLKSALSQCHESSPGPNDIPSESLSSANTSLRSRKLLRWRRRCPTASTMLTLMIRHSDVILVPN